MLCTIVLLSLTTLVLGLSPSVLNVSVKAAASTVASVDDIVIGVVVYNPTDKDIRVIARNNILDTSATRSFNVSDVNGKLVWFGGVRALYDLSASGIYMTIPAGGYVAVNHTNIGALYDFESSGTGTFTFEPIARFQKNSDNPPEVVDVPPVKVEVTNDVKRRNPYQRPTFPGRSDASMDPDINYLLTDVISPVSLRLFDKLRGESGDIPYFPDPPVTVFLFIAAGQSQSTPSSHLSINRGSDPAGICGDSGGVISYTITGYEFIDAFNGDVGYSFQTYLCDAFDSIADHQDCSNIGPTDSSQAGVIVHELRNQLAAFLLDEISYPDTTDVAYGCPAVASISAEDQLKNPDNYRVRISPLHPWDLITRSVAVSVSGLRLRILGFG
ncbi:hypothetical protein C0993_001768 [Termitomyces sp. T159_Od127]|nr:hypothetical protein C0993_001768 [Termitomyces sp. T159_Od127]